MGNGFVRTFAAIFVLVICLTCSAQASLFRDTVVFLESDGAVSFRIRPEAEKLSQFDDNRSSQLNRLLRHLEIVGAVNGENTEVAFTLDSEELFSILEWKSKETMISFPAASGRSTCILPEIQKEADVTGFGQKVQADNPLFWNRSIYHSLDVYHVFFSNLPAAFPDHASSGKISEKYRDYGTAVRKITVVVQGEDLNSYLLNQKNSYAGMGYYPDPSEIVFEGRQSFTMLFSADNALIRVMYSGHAGLSAGDIRNVRLDWKTVRGNSLEKDEIELRTPNSSGTKRDNFLLTHILKTDADGSEAFTWSAETDRVSGGVRTREFSKASLNFRENRISGTMSERSSSRGKESTAEILLDSSVGEEHSYSGTLEIICKKDKIEKEKWLFLFDLSDVLPLQGTFPVSEMIPEENVSAQDIQEQLAASVLRRLLMLPAEDLSFLKDGIPDNLWDEILQIGNN